MHNMNVARDIWHKTSKSFIEKNIDHTPYRFVNIWFIWWQIIKAERGSWFLKNISTVFLATSLHLAWPQNSLQEYNNKLVFLFWPIADNFVTLLVTLGIPRLTMNSVSIRWLRNTLAQFLSIVRP